MEFFKSFLAITSTFFNILQTEFCMIDDRVKQEVLVAKKLWYLYHHIKQWCGSGFIWVRGSRVIKSLIKWREKQSLTNKNIFFSRRNLFFKSEVQSDLKISFFLTFKYYKMFWKFGDFIDLDPDPDWSNFVDPYPHHWYKTCSRKSYRVFPN